MTIDQVGGHLAGELAGGGAAHPVGDHEQRPARADLVFAHLGQQARVPTAQVGDQEGVFVVVAGAAQIGLAEDRHFHRTRAHARASTTPNPSDPSASD